MKCRTLEKQRENSALPHFPSTLFLCFPTSQRFLLLSRNTRCCFIPLIKYIHILTVCNIPSPLGMESFEIPDSSITASSSYSYDHSAKFGRLRMAAKNGHKGGWSAKTNDKNQWLQIDLGSTMKVNKIATQGRQDTSQWVTSFQLSYSIDGSSFLPFGSARVSSLIDRQYSLYYTVAWSNEFYFRVVKTKATKTFV